MLKIIDVDYIADFLLDLTFSDGFQGRVDLTNIFKQPPLAAVKDFKRFSLAADGSLNWGENKLTAIGLRTLAKGEYCEQAASLAAQDIEAVIKQASWESIAEGRPDILQAAIRSYVEQLGHSKVIAKAGISSRTSAYKSLNPDTTPNFGTLVRLGHAVVELVKEANLTKKEEVTV